MKILYSIIVISTIGYSIEALLLFSKGSPGQNVKAGQTQHVKEKQENQKAGTNLKPREVQRQLTEEELQKELTESIDYVFELVTEKLKTYKPIWMNFGDNSLMERLKQFDTVNKRERYGGNQSKKRKQPPPSAVSSRQSPPLRILHKRSLLAVPVDKSPRFQNYDYPDYALSTNNSFDYSYDGEDAKVRLGNVAAVPLRILRNGALRLKRIRGFVAGSVPVRVAPIVLTTDPKNRLSSNIRVLLKGRVRFNYFDESNDLGPEIYLVQLVTANEFDVVTQPPRKKEKSKKVPENLRLRFERELDDNGLQATLQEDLSKILRNVLREENATGSFHLDRH